MLKRIERDIYNLGASVSLINSDFKVLFTSGLEYSAPARGTWNIVHIGMLIPEIHQIFVCAQGCLRGVVLTAAEMKAMDRFSTIAVRENNIIEGDMEKLIIDGVADILCKLKKRPKAILIYTSCVHHFMGCDLDMVYRTLREKYPDIAFTDCYMNPIMRKSGFTPDQIMRRQLYSLIEKKEKSLDKHSVNIIGNNVSTDSSSELIRMIKENGYECKDITYCSNYDEYQSMAQSFMNISYLPVAKAGGADMEKRLGQKHLYLPLCYGFDEIEENLLKLAESLNISMPDYTNERQAAKQAINNAYNKVNDIPIAIDYTATPRPLGLARLLVEHGFNVERIYADSFNGEEYEDYLWLKQKRPELMIYATVHAKMRVLEREYGKDKKVLAIGQKAAYFTGTDYFVNIVEGGGMYGYDGIVRLSRLIIESFEQQKDTKRLIQIKGWGCETCL